MALVVLLRGVNVGGHRTFRPSALAEQLREFDAVNIGAAGTFVVRQPVSRAHLRAEFERRLPFDAEIMICSGSEIAGLMSRDFFRAYTVRPDVVRFVSLLSRSPRSAPSTPLNLPSAGRWLVKILARENRLAVGLYRRHMKTISYLGTLDRVFGVPVTTRNWNTITAIVGVLNRDGARTGVPRGRTGSRELSRGSAAEQARARRPAGSHAARPGVSRNVGPIADSPAGEVNRQGRSTISRS